MKTKNILIAILIQFAAAFASPEAWSQSERNPSVWVQNDSSRRVFSIYSTPTTQSNWGDDLLGENILPQGRRFALRFREGECLRDIRVDFEGVGGRAAQLVSQNFCQYEGIRVTDRGLVMVPISAPAPAARQDQQNRPDATPEGAVRTAEQVLADLRRFAGVDVRPDGSVVVTPSVAKRAEFNRDGQLVITPQDAQGQEQAR